MMFISRFNKLIRNKVVWSVFAFIVVLSFVAWTTTTGGSHKGEQANRLGKLEGKPVPAAEFQSAYFNSLLSASLMFGRPLQVNQHLDEALRNMAWRRLITLRMAKNMNIAVAGEEVLEAIHQQPYFSLNGQFQPDRYAAFLNYFLANLQTTEAQFEEYIRQELLLNKTKYLLAQAVWAAPQEIEEFFHQLYDTFVISYAFIDWNDIEPSIKISEDEALAYFQDHREEFKIPEKMRVKGIAFPIADYVDKDSLTEDILRDYYEDNIEKFTTPDSNDQLVATPFETVADELRQQLAWESALEQAGDQASDCEVALVPDKEGHAPTFEEAAATLGLPIFTSTYFSAQEAIPELENKLEFSQTAFELRRTPDGYFSQPLQGDHAFYLLAYDDRHEARPPDYQEVRLEVMAAAKKKMVSEQLDHYAQRVYAAAAGACATGATLELALKDSGLEVETTEPFSVKAGVDDHEFEHFKTLVKHILTQDVGGLTELLPVENGYVFGYVVSRAPANPTLLETIRGDLGWYIRNQRENQVFSDWQDHLLAAAKFEDLAHKPNAASLFEDQELNEDLEED